MLLSTSVSHADIGVITDSGSFLAQAQSRFLPLYYETTCSVTITGTGSAFKIFPESSPDGGKTYTPVTTIGGGVITANGTYTGAVPVLPTALTNGFTLVQVSRMNGQVNYSITCSANNTLPRGGSSTSVPDDGSSSVSVTFAQAFISSVGSVTLTPSNYSGSDNAAIMCRIVGSPTLTGFTAICMGGASGSTVTLNYSASGT